jgi:hypothetical protein
MTEEDIDVATIDVAIEQFRLAAVRYGMEKENKSSLGYGVDPQPFREAMYQKQAELKELIKNKLLEIL